MENCRYTSKVAVAPFYCGICGEHVKIGDIYLDYNGKKSCMCALPERKLRPKDNKNEKALDHLRIENLKMRLDLETISMHPEGKAAKKIIAKYTRQRKIRNELYLSTQN